MQIIQKYKCKCKKTNNTNTNAYDPIETSPFLSFPLFCCLFPPREGQRYLQETSSDSIITKYLRQGQPPSFWNNTPGPNRSDQAEEGEGEEGW